MKDSELERIIEDRKFVMVAPEELRLMSPKTIQEYLEYLLEPEIKNEIWKRVLPIKITQQAIDKANKIAELASPYEIGLVLLGSKFEEEGLNNLVVRDIYIPIQQDPVKTNKTMCLIEADGWYNVQSFAQSNHMEILGWAHSHAEMNTFHSIEDDHNIRNYALTKSRQYPNALSFHMGCIETISYCRSAVFDYNGNSPFFAVAYLPKKYSQFYSAFQEKGKRLIPIIKSH